MLKRKKLLAAALMLFAAMPLAPLLQETAYGYEVAAEEALEISLDKSSIELKMGTGGDILRCEVMPHNMSGEILLWESSNTGVVTVDGEGRLTPVGVGEAVVTVKTSEGGAYASCNVKVIQPPSGVKLSADTMSIKVGERKYLTAQVLPENVTNKTIIWRSSNMDVATVENGLVIAAQTGLTLITAETEDGSYSAKCEVIVDPAPAGAEANAIKDVQSETAAPETVEAAGESVPAESSKEEAAGTLLQDKASEDPNVKMNYPLFIGVIAVIAGLIGLSFLPERKDKNN